MTPHPKVAVIGGGPAGLMAADVLSKGGAHVTIYDRMPSVGRKFLLAGRGGLNLTHSEDLAPFLSRYGAREAALKASIEAMPPAAVRAWCEGHGQETFVGSSGRVFPRVMKASPLLRAWLRELRGRSVVIATRHAWRGFDPNGRITFQTPTDTVQVEADATVLALGGASWPKLGSDGSWVANLRNAGLTIADLEPANCGFLVAWSALFRDRYEGEPLKRIAVQFGSGAAVRGEALITKTGIEGGAIYALSAHLREAIKATGAAQISIDLRPDLDLSTLAAAVAVPRKKQSLSSFLRKAAYLSPVAIGLLQEHAHSAGLNLGTMAPDALAALVKAVPVTLIGAAPLASAISTAGGVSFEEIDTQFMLKKRPGTFVAGEMLDWEAPTGGYLLQACLATGAAAGHGALEWLAKAGHTAQKQ